MVQDIRTEQVFTELDMTSAKSESALWSILGFYFSIIFGLLAVLILLKTIKLGRWLDFTSSSVAAEVNGDEVEKPATPAKATKSPAKKTDKANMFAQPPKGLNGKTPVSPARTTTATKTTASPTKKPAKATTSTAMTPPRAPAAPTTKTPTPKRSSGDALTTTGRKRAKKDPDAPKRPTSAYLLFQNDKRAELRQANPHMTSNEINGLASHLWKHVYTEAQKQPYLEKEKALKEQYKIESAAYQANKKEEAMQVDDEPEQKETNDKKLEKSPRRPKDPNAPKRPKTAYLCFNSDAQVRSWLKTQNPAATPQEILRLLGERWAAMTPHEKQPYEQMAQQEQATYKVQKEAYDQKKAADVIPQVVVSNENSTDVKEASKEGGGLWGNVSNLFHRKEEIKTKTSSPTKKPLSKKIPTKKTTPVKAKTTPVKRKLRRFPFYRPKGPCAVGNEKHDPVCLREYS